MLDFILVGLLILCGMAVGALLGIGFVVFVIKRKVPPKGSIVMVIAPEGVPGILRLQQLSETPDPAIAIQKACELYMILLQQQAFYDAEIVLRIPTGEEQVITII